MITETSTPAPSPAPRRRRSNPLFLILGLSALLFVVFSLASGYLLMKKGGGVPGKAAATIALSKERVGVVELNGVILDSKRPLKQLQEFEDSAAVKAVVLRLNSPGGAVAPSQEIYEAVKKYSKPLVVSMSSVAASGAYYIAMGSSQVYANPGTITGSIGVIMQFSNLEKLYEWAKISRYSIKTGKFKDSGADYRPMAPEERALLQGMVDDTLSQFKLAVKTGRKLTDAEVDAVADGRIFSGQQAKAAKLVDELGTLQDAIEAAAKLGGIQGKPKTVYPEKGRKKFIEWLMQDGDEDSMEENSSVGSSAASQLWIRFARDILGMPSAAPRLEPGMYWLLPWSA